MIPQIAKFFDALIPRASGGPLTLSDPNAWDEAREGSSKSDAGLRVGAEEALRFGPVYQCLEIKSGDIGVSTMHCHKNKVEPGEDDIDYNQSAEKVCSQEWNDEMPANEGWQNLVFHQQLWGDGYAYIARQGGSPNGPIKWMANLPPTHVTPYTDPTTKSLMYKYCPTGIDEEDEFLFPWEVFHLRSLAIENYRSLKLLGLMKNELGLALGSKLFLSKFFQRGGHHGGILQIPVGTNPASRENLEKGVEKRASPDNWFRTLVLRDGATWQSSTIDPRTAQMHELNEDEARAVCNFFNMPPWKIGVKNAESYNSAEQAQRAYITGTLLHVSCRIQGEARIKLLAERTRRARSHRFEHNFSKLLESDVKTLNEVLAIQRANEVISANDWRKKINLPERDDEKANEFYNPNTRAGADAAANDSESDGTDMPKKTKKTMPDEHEDDMMDRTQRKPHLQKMLHQGMARASRRLATISRNKARKPNELLTWCDARAAEHASIVAEELETPLLCCLPEARASMVLLATQAWLTTSLTSGVAVFLEAPHKPGDLAESVDTFCGEFMTTVCDRWQKEILDDAIH